MPENKLDTDTGSGTVPPVTNTDERLPAAPENLQSKEEYADDGYMVKLSNFEGPLDLLLYLIKEAKIDIKDIFISKKYKIINLNDQIDIHDYIYLYNNTLLLVTDDFNQMCLASNCNIKNLAFIINNNIQVDRKLFDIDNFFFINFTDKLTIPKFRINFLKTNNMLKYNINNNIDNPFVSCICPTYNRSLFLPILINNFHNQDYPKECCELIILDDSKTDNAELINKLDIYNNIKYYHIKYHKPLSIGRKRNLLHQLVSGQYIVCFDDDDYYPNNRISHAISSMINNKINFAGSSKLLIFYSHLNKIYQFGPYSHNHATNGTLAYHRSIVFKNFYDDNSYYAEERVFLNNFSEKIIQLDISKTILCISHNNNTFDKKKIINNGKVTKFKLKNIVKNKYILEFYKSL